MHINFISFIDVFPLHSNKINIYFELCIIDKEFDLFRTSYKSNNNTHNCCNLPRLKNLNTPRPNYRSLRSRSVILNKSDVPLSFLNMERYNYEVGKISAENHQTATLCNNNFLQTSVFRCVCIMTGISTFKNPKVCVSAPSVVDVASEQGYGLRCVFYVSHRYLFLFFVERRNFGSIRKLIDQFQRNSVSEPTPQPTKMSWGYEKNNGTVVQPDPSTPLTPSPPPTLTCSSA